MEILYIFKNQASYILAFVLVTSIDFLTGTINAIIKREYSSGKLRNGIAKDLSYFAFAILGCILEFVFEQPIAKWFCVLAISIEAVSIIENTAKISGLPIFDKIKTKLFGSLLDIDKGGDDIVI